MIGFYESFLLYGLKRNNKHRLEKIKKILYTRSNNNSNNSTVKITNQKLHGIEDLPFAHNRT